MWILFRSQVIIRSFQLFPIPTNHLRNFITFNLEDSILWDNFFKKWFCIFLQKIFFILAIIFVIYFSKDLENRLQMIDIYIYFLSYPSKNLRIVHKVISLIYPWGILGSLVIFHYTINKRIYRHWFLVWFVYKDYRNNLKMIVFLWIILFYYNKKNE